MWTPRIATVALLATALALATSPVSALEAGDQAPEFEIQSTKGTIRLTDFRGSKNVLLAFYFKDFTGG